MTEQLVATPPTDFKPEKCLFFFIDPKDEIDLFVNCTRNQIELNPFAPALKRVKILKSSEEILDRQRKYNKEYATRESTKKKQTERAMNEDNKKKRKDYADQKEVKLRKQINSTLNRKILRDIKVNEKQLYEQKKLAVIESLPPELKPQPLPPRKKRVRKEKKTDEQVQGPFGPIAVMHTVTELNDSDAKSTTAHRKKRVRKNTSTR